MSILLSSSPQCHTSIMTCREAPIHHHTTLSLKLHTRLCETQYITHTAKPDKISQTEWHCKLIPCVSSRDNGWRSALQKGKQTRRCWESVNFCSGLVCLVLSVREQCSGVYMCEFVCVCVCTRGQCNIVLDPCGLEGANTWMNLSLQTHCFFSSSDYTPPKYAQQFLDGSLYTCVYRCACKTG